MNLFMEIIKKAPKDCSNVELNANGEVVKYIDDCYYLIYINLLLWYNLNEKIIGGKYAIDKRII